MGSKILKGLVWISAIFTFAFLIMILVYIFVQGVPHLTPSLFAWEFTPENQSLMPALITTLYLILGALLLAVPLGVFTAIYLVEYSDRSKWYVKMISMATDTLAAVPSIVYGLFGMLAFNNFLGFNYSLLSGILTVTIMVLPLIITATEEALLSVDDSLRSASYGLGAGRLRTIFNVVMPVAMPGVLSGVILAIGRIVGETAALMFTLGTSVNLPTSLLQPGRTLALHMYVLSSESLHKDQAWATAVVLIIFVLIINGISSWLSSLVTNQNKSR